jgi:hypothetical protein
MAAEATHDFVTHHQYAPLMRQPDEVLQGVCRPGQRCIGGTPLWLKDNDTNFFAILV